MNREFVIFLVVIGFGWLLTLVTANLSPTERHAIRWAAMIPLVYLVLWRFWLSRR